MMVRALCLAVWAVLSAVSLSFSAGGPTEFQKNNPDNPGKYAFARSYISALGHVNSIDRRWKKSPRKVFKKGDDVQLMRGYVSYIIKDDADYRIAKNYLAKYLESPNLLIRKTADTFIVACQMHLAINAKEKEIWDQWFAVKSSNLATITNERAFVKTQEDLARKRKETNAQIIEASVLLTKVLKSQRNADEKGRLLAITAKERAKLLDLLDGFGKDTLDWGLKPGQNHMQASVASIREILEDTIYTPLDE